MTARLRLKDIFGGRTVDGASPKANPPHRAGRRSVDYRLVRARRRSIGMQIDFSGPHRARAALGVAIARSRQTLLERGAWILRSLDEWRARRRDVLPREWKTGAPILYRGRELALACLAAPTREIAPDLFDLTVLHPPPRRTNAQVAAFVARWLREEALALRAAARRRHTRRESRRRRRRSSCPTRAANGEAATARARSGSTGGSSSCRPTLARLRRRARSRALGRAQSFARGSGRWSRRCFPAMRHARATRAATSWTRAARGRERSAARAARTCMLAATRERGSSTVDAAPVSRRSARERCAQARRPTARVAPAAARAARSESRRSVRRPTSRGWALAIDDDLAAVAAVDLEDAVVQAPVDVGVAVASAASSAAPIAASVRVGGGDELAFGDHGRHRRIRAATIPPDVT